MCGIAGFTNFHSQLGDSATLMAMGESMTHRGPDAHGSFADQFVGLHHRRLAIIDLNEASNQPMEYGAGRYQIVFNGEIYNFLELRDELKAEGFKFQTQSDTEVILALYQRDQAKCLDSLNGMFAFAIWDSQKQELFIARDRLGKKPLYYSHKNGDLAFASEIKALMRCDWFSRELRTDAVYDFFAYQYVPDPKTIFRDTHKLSPGHYAIVNRSGVSIQRYWDPSFAEDPLASPEDLEHLSALIDQSTRRRMIADVPLGAFLSGGIDSSGIVALMAADSTKPITTCSIGFDQKEFNETEFASLVASSLNTDHHEFTVTDKVADSLHEIVRFFDEPFADPSLIPTYFVSKLARRKVTVALAGDGGDEVFAGYEKYSIDQLENRWRKRVPKVIRERFFPSMAQLCRKIPLRLFGRAATLLRALAHSPAEAFYYSNAQIDDDEWESLALTQTKNRLQGYHPKQITVDAYNGCDGPNHLAKILYTDLKTYLPGDILVKVDRMSMAHSLEVRAPLLDYKLVEYAARLPSSMKIQYGEKKWALKQVFSPKLPTEILDRKKMGFSVPLDEWFRGDLKGIWERTVLQAADGLPNFFSQDTISSLWDAHQRGRRDHGALLWSLLIFQLWWNEYMDSP
ncbi:MAG: asparagine synthase (glutamine-hydrolyzing) [Pseudomonadota bacterium]